MAVRYITLPRVSLELITAMSAEDNAVFNRIVFSCFQQMDNGEKPTFDNTDNPILNIALREAITELERGYNLYKKRASGGKTETNDQPLVDQCPTNAQPLVNEHETNGITTGNQCPTIEEKRKEKERNGNGITENTYTIKSSPLRITEAERAEIESRLSDFGIEPDAGFWNTCFLYGYKAVCDALNKAEETESYNLKYITGLIRKGT